MNSERRGFVLVSFGTSAYINKARFFSIFHFCLKIPHHIVEAFIAAMEHFSDVDFIWKFTVKTNVELPPNVHTRSFVPQHALLSEFLLRLFTQALNEQNNLQTTLAVSDSLLTPA